MKAIAGFLFWLLLAGSAQAVQIEGFWSGVATRAGQQTPVSLHVEDGPQGLRAHYNIPALSLEGMPLNRFAYDPATGQITTARSFKGRVDGGRLRGELFPALLHGPPVQVELQRAGDPPVLAAVVAATPRAAGGPTSSRDLRVVPNRPDPRPRPPTDRLSGRVNRD